MSTKEGLGTLGYNHSYVAAQILLLLIFRTYICRDSRIIIRYTFLLASLVACLLTGSRAGLAAMIFYILFIMFNRPIVAIAAGGITGALYYLIPSQLLTAELTTTLLTRQAAIFDPANTENLAGRDVIWSTGFQFMNENLLHWVSGIGFGSTVDGPGFLHMLYFQIVVEMGIFALVGFLIAVVALLNLLRKIEKPPKPVFWGIIALLFASLVQETFYPVPAFGGFISLFLFVLAVVFANTSSHNDDKSSVT